MVEKRLYTDLDINGDILPDPDFENEQIELFKENNPEEEKKFKIKRIKFALTKKQVDDMLNQALKTNVKHFNILKTLIKSGLRRSELLNLPIYQVNFDGKEMIIETREEKTRYLDDYSTKTESSNRIIPLSDELISCLRKEIGKRKNGYVFVSQKGGKFAARSITRIVNKYAMKAPTIGKNIGAHATRRTYASFLMANKIKIGTISKLLGHHSVKTTMEYLYWIEDKSDFDEVRRVIDTIDTVRRKE